MDFFHLLNRGVDKRDVFLGERDYVRFTQNLYILNDTNSAPHNDWSTELRLQASSRDPLVIIHAYCLMPNHYHLLVSPLVENGVSLFMQKINMGYTKYFNERNERSGSLWQGKYKLIQIENDSHFNYIPYYIHLNPLDLILPEWRKGNVTNFKKAITFLGEYRWSSHGLFLEPQTIHDSIIHGSFYKKNLKQQSQYIEEIKNIISNNDIAEFSQTIEYN